MKHRKYSGSILKSATSGAHLSTRLNINAKYSSNDLIGWQKSLIKFKKNSRILDIGCGNGAQSSFIFQKLSSNGSLISIDYSKKSIDILKTKINAPNFNCFVADMDKYNQYMDGRYDIIHSSYAMYYSSNPDKLLKECYKRLNKNGKLIITVPCFPHTLVEESNKINKVPANVTQSLNFFQNILLPKKKKFKSVKINNFQNTLRISKKEDLRKIYRATTYYNKKSEKFILEKFDTMKKKYGFFKIEKNAKMIIYLK